MEEVVCNDIPNQNCINTYLNMYISSIENILYTPIKEKPLGLEERILLTAQMSSIKAHQTKFVQPINTSLDSYSSTINGGQSMIEKQIINKANQLKIPKTMK